jgi:hypothetical protein
MAASAWLYAHGCTHKRMAASLWLQAHGCTRMAVLLSAWLRAHGCVRMAASAWLGSLLYRRDIVDVVLHDAWKGGNMDVTGLLAWESPSGHRKRSEPPAQMLPLKSYDLLSFELFDDGFISVSKSSAM